MIILNISIIIFVVMELANVIILYCKPDLKYGNSVAVFDSYIDSKDDEHMNLFIKYLINWVAGTKIIFIVLLVVVLIFGNELTKVFSVAAMILSIATYYFRLNPLIKKMDKIGTITPKGYSKTLFWMITGFMTMFSLALIIYVFLKFII